MNISEQFLKTAMQEPTHDYPWLSIHAACVDFTRSMPVPDESWHDRAVLPRKGLSESILDLSDLTEGSNQPAAA